MLPPNTCYSWIRARIIRGSMSFSDRKLQALFAKVISKDRNCQIWLIFHLDACFLNNCFVTFYLFWLEASHEGYDELPKDGYDCMVLKV